MKEFQNITNKQIEQYGVQSLADRPNSTGGYGDKGLSALELKLAFDKFATFLAGKINEIHKVLAGDEAGEYIAVLLRDSGIENLAELAAAIESGKMAQILQLYPAASETERVSLQNVVYSFAKTLSEHGKTISEVLKYPTYTESDPTVPAWAKKPNPPTAAEVGAAPGGLFVGAYSVSASATDADIDTMLTSVLSVMGNSEIKYISFTNSASSTSLPNGYWTMKIDKFTSTMAIVEATNKYTSIYAKLVRAYSNESWQSWEWVNPPMKPGVEYRTTERVNGKPVYYKMVDCGTYPNNAVKEVAHGASNIQFIYVADATTYSGDTISLLPNVSVWAGLTVVKVKTTENLSVYKLWVTIKYTKTT